MRNKKKAQRNESLCISHERLGVNILSASITCLVLFASALAIAPKSTQNGGFVHDINRISENLDKALFGVLGNITGPNFTEINVTATYYSSAEFNPRGMAGLYNITNIFMDVLVSRNIFPEDLIIVNKGVIQLAAIEDQWQALLSQFAGLFVIILILVLIAVLMPLCGFFFCCCRCCGKCGAKSEPLNKKKDCGRKFTLATLLIVTGTLLLFGVVCSFVTSQHMHDGGNEFIPSVRRGLQDVDSYLNATGKEIHILLKTNYKEFEVELFSILDRSSAIVYEQLAVYSNAVAMTQISAIVDGLTDIRSNLTEMKNITLYLRNHASQLNDALRKVKRDLLYTLRQCDGNPECSKLSKNVQELQMNVDFNSLPDVTEQTKALDNILLGDIVGSIEEGKHNLQEIEEGINKTVYNSLGAVRNAVLEAGSHVSRSVTNVTNLLNRISDTIDGHTKTSLNDAERYIGDYLPYWYYLGIGISCVLLVIVLYIAFGLICGICGKKPDHYNDDCCNKGVGSRCLICGVGVMFLTSLILAVVTIVCFVLGVFSQRLVCDSLRNYNDSKVIQMIDKYIDLTPTLGTDLTIKHVLSQCHINETAYNVFRLDSQFDLQMIMQYFDDDRIEDALNKLQEEINMDDDIKILTDTAKQKLMELAYSEVADIKFDRFTEVLDHNLTKVDLNFLIQQLETVIQTVKRHHIKEDIQGQLEVSKLHLETYQQKLVEPMTKNAEKLIDIAKNMEHNLKFGRDSFRDAIVELIEEVQDAEDFLRINGTYALQAIARNFATAITGQVDSYVNRVVYSIENDIGQCGPLSNVINATLMSTCDQILLPMNGFWFVLFWSLLLFIILIILSVKLASLYQKFDPYPYPGESEYLYDAYADREIIPLASNGKPSKKKKKNKKYDNRSNYPSEVGDHPGARRDYPSSSGQDTRYSDIAPRQHWEDFPNGGPPQYQRAPTEYERPPPYNYYPGSGDQQQ